MLKTYNRELTKCTGSFLHVSAFAVVLSIGLLGADRVRAETLNDALIATYIKNPTLNAQRAQLRVTDEGVAIAKSGFRPKITGSGSATYQDTKSDPVNTLSDGETRSRNYTVSLAQPIFRGFRTINTLRQAEADVLAGREDLRGVEQTTFLETVTAYMDVVRDLAIVSLRENNVKVLTKQLRATKDRFQVGEVTKTDVAQANARRSGAVSQLSLAKANLESSRAVYQRLVGHRPGRLRAPNGLTRYIPKSIKVAQEIGDAEHPTVLGAIYRKQSAKHAVKIIIGELLPEVNVNASYSNTHTETDLDSGAITPDRDTEVSTVTGSLTVPIYQGGAVSARVRQAKQTLSQRNQQVVEAQIGIKAQIIAAWGRWEAAQAQLISDGSQVEASRTALNGVREEEKVGQRTILDVLDAEQEFLDAQVSLSTTKRDSIVAGYSVLSSIGRLSASDLNLAVPVYEATRYYDKVKGKWFGFGKSGIYGK